MTNKEDLPQKEILRLDTMMEYERSYADCKYICGVDEVGRGPLAGPVVACAGILPKETYYRYLNDSKKVTEKRREILYGEITEEAVSYSFGVVSAQVIDEINILQATYRAMREAVEGLAVRPDKILVDAVHIPGIDIPQVEIIKGDAKSVSIAAASIVAKVYRDRMMTDYDKLYPEYMFAKNKGYGTKAHMEALRTAGMSPIHRKTFVHIS